MTLDDRTTDAQPHPHSVGLGAVQRLEEFVSVAWRDPSTNVMHAERDLVVVILHRRDRDDPVLLVGARHRLDGVLDQVEDDLLQQDAVSSHERRIVSKIAVHGHTRAIELAAQQSQSASTVSFRLTRSMTGCRMAKSARSRLIKSTTR